ncbi:MAG: carbon starvation protein A [Deltaproteobacteria bacterium]|nr:carbon starvation protein A [Deltaproteobacteria bacterium]
MWAFLGGIGVLILGYAFYGRLAVKPLRPDPMREVPAVRLADGMDYVAMPTWRVYLVQLLNIAGLGPVFGPIMGALWGPQVFLWVVFGAVLGGAVHDLLSGAMSMRNDGAGLPDLIGHYLGKLPRHVATFFILLLMVLVGTVFVKGPAALIVKIVPAEMVGGLFGDGAVALLSSTFQGQPVWLWIVMACIFAYYIVATLLPIDKLIGRIYPVFAIALLVMVIGLAVSALSGRLDVPDFTLANLHPKGTPAWPIIFITVSCGAISGFHATQSPMMARCLKSERHMRLVFYGAMIAEGLIALVWATAAQGYYEGGVAGLAAALSEGNAATVVHTICTGTMGSFGGLLAVLGVVVLPITSGDTAFRVARLIAADYLKLPQKKVLNRYKIALPLFAISIALNFIPFGVIWRYFGWANQTLAAVTLWAGAVFLARRARGWCWLAALPATFMTVMTVTYILVESRENGCAGLDPLLGTIIGAALGLAALIAFVWIRPRLSPEPDTAQVPARPSEAEREADKLAC